MKIFIASSKHFYHLIPPIQAALEAAGHIITLPNSYEEPMKELEMKELGAEAHREWKATMIRKKQGLLDADTLLVLNFEKEGRENYIGGGTFIEVFVSFDAGKKIFFYNPLPDGIFADELKGMGPVVINGDLSLVR